MIANMRDLKCQCCRCYDSFDGCQAFDCQYDFEISMARVKEVAESYGMSADTIMALLMAEEAKNRDTAENCNDEDDAVLPDDFDPYRDTQFMISFADSTNLGKRMLIEMAPEDLKRLKAEIDAVLRIQEGD